MKKQLTLLLPLAVVGVAVLSFAGDLPNEKPAATPEVGQMQSEIADLRAKVQTLEDRLKSLESTVAQMKQPHLMPLFRPEPNSRLSTPPIIEPKPPKIWGEREINGWTFYIVPCGQKTP